jgi:hypothetical protein
MIDLRARVVSVAFHKLDVDSDGILNKKDIMDFFNNNVHIDQLSGKKITLRAQKEFMRAFNDGGKNNDFVISKEDFMRYYDNLSSTIVNQGKFSTLIIDTWYLSTDDLSIPDAELFISPKKSIPSTSVSSSVDANDDCEENELKKTSDVTISQEIAPLNSKKFKNRRGGTLYVQDEVSLDMIFETNYSDTSPLKYSNMRRDKLDFESSRLRSPKTTRNANYSRRSMLNTLTPNLSPPQSMLNTLIPNPSPPHNSLPPFRPPSPFFTTSTTTTATTRPSSRPSSPFFTIQKPIESESHPVSIQVSEVYSDEGYNSPKSPKSPEPHRPIGSFIARYYIVGCCYICVNYKNFFICIYSCILETFVLLYDVSLLQ